MFSRNWVEFEAVTELPERLETVLLFAIISQSNTAANGGVMYDRGSGSDGNVNAGGGTINQTNNAMLVQKSWRWSLFGGR